MKKEDLQFLNQLVKSLEDAALKLESAEKEQNYYKFKKIKLFMEGIQEKIESLLKQK